MFIEREFIEKWMKRVVERLEHVEALLTLMMNKPKTAEKEKERPKYDGVVLYDNYDLCKMLNVSKRSLQRYRSLGWLPYKQIDQKIYYLETEVEKFISERMKTIDDRKNANNEK